MNIRDIENNLSKIKADNPLFESEVGISASKIDFENAEKRLNIQIPEKTKLLVPSDNRWVGYISDEGISITWGNS